MGFRPDDAWLAKHGHKMTEIGKPKKKTTISKYEELFAHHVKLYELPIPIREHRFHQERRWRFDFAWPEQMLAVEIEGVTRYGKNADGTMKLGRHQTAKGLEADCEKYNAALLGGWRVLRFTQPMVKSGQAIENTKTMLNKSTGKNI